MTCTQQYWEDVRDGAATPDVVYEVTYRRAIIHVGAGRDFMPGHHDPEAARRQGVRTLYVNTLFHASFIDRVLTDWGGPGTFIARRNFSMISPICVGDIIRGSGIVVGRNLDETGRGAIEMVVNVVSEYGPCTHADCRILLPRRARTHP